MTRSWWQPGEMNSDFPSPSQQQRCRVSFLPPVVLSKYVFKGVRTTLHCLANRFYLGAPKPLSLNVLKSLHRAQRVQNLKVFTAEGRQRSDPADIRQGGWAAAVSGLLEPETLG